MMREKMNFCAGPAMVPHEVEESAVRAVLDFAGTGVSLLSTSHRTSQWQEVMDECVQLWKELLNIPEGYQVLLLPGGASMGFLYAVQNFFEHKAAYLDTGVWASKAMKEARMFGPTEVVASSADRNYSYIPKNYAVPADADYFHITSNNTIYGTQMHYDPLSPVPMIADMSSDILSRRVDVSRYAMIYGGAQKNAGTAGIGFYIVREDALGKVTRHIPSMLDLRLMIKHGSMFNTPPMFPIFVMRETLRWVKQQGGVDEMERRSRERAKVLYSALEESPVFVLDACREDRSLMNVKFSLDPRFADREQTFLDYTAERGVVGIRGHRLSGGFRASIYNACPLEHAQALAQMIRQFGQTV